MSDLAKTMLLTASFAAFILLSLMPSPSSSAHAAQPPAAQPPAAQPLAASCRSNTPVNHFKKLTGFPFGRNGFVVDHVCALECGGKDAPDNMQWQTVQDSKIKDRWETTKAGCSKTCTPQNSTPSRQVFNCK